MAIPIASIGSLPATLEPSARVVGTAAAPDTAPQTGNLFGALLATQAAPATPETALLELAPELTTELTTEPIDATGLAGLLAFAAQLLNIPANAAVAQANGETAPAAPPVQLPADPRARADQLALDTAQALPTDPQPAPALVPTAPAVPVEALADPVPLAEPAEPSAAELADRAARSPRTGAPNVVAQPPLLTVGVPVPPAAPALNEVTPPVAEPVAAVPTSALPDATLGARPSTAGEQFAALASSGERLAAPTEFAPIERPREPEPARFATAVGDALPPADAPTAEALTVDAPRPAGDVRDVRNAGDAGDIIELPPALPQAPAPTNAPTQRIAFPATRGGIPVAAPVAQPEPAVAQSALVIASAGERPAPRDLTPTDAPPADPASAAPALSFGTFAPPAPERTGPAPPAPPAAPSAPPAAVQVAEALVSRAEFAKRDGATEFQMRLDPPELGRVHVKLVASGDELRGHVLVADDAVRRLLESQLPELRHKLEAAGVSVQALDVATDPSGGNRGSFREERDERPAFAPPAARAEPPRRPLPAPAPVRVGALDVTV